MNQRPSTCAPGARLRPSRASAATRLALACALACGFAGCATVDPLEPVNRKVFAFNDAVDGAVLKPTALFYRDNVPYPVRTGVRNFFANVKDVWSAANLMLQGRVGESFQEGLRFSVNTVFGVAGTIDIATEMGIESHRQDLGLTLGRWGVKPGPYIVLPLLGPTTLRDSVSIPFDMYFSPETFVEDSTAKAALGVLHLVDTRTNLLVLTDVLDDVALDRYTFVRDGWLQRRQNLIHDGDDDESDEDGSRDAEPADGEKQSTLELPADAVPAAAALPASYATCLHRAIVPRKALQAALHENPPAPALPL